MKKLLTMATILILMAAACTKQTETTVNDTGSTQTTTVSADVPEVDTAATAAATAATTDAANDAAHAAGTAMETAGQAIQENTTDNTKTDN